MFLMLGCLLVHCNRLPSLCKPRNQCPLYIHVLSRMAYVQDVMYYFSLRSTCAHLDVQPRCFMSQGVSVNPGSYLAVLRHTHVISACPGKFLLLPQQTRVGAFGKRLESRYTLQGPSSWQFVLSFIHWFPVLSPGLWLEIRQRSVAIFLVDFFWLYEWSHTFQYIYLVSGNHFQKFGDSGPVGWTVTLLLFMPV